jgi:hypothetical protein
MTLLFPKSGLSKQPPSLLLSEEGCIEQDFHYDYDPNEEESYLSFSSIVFLENNGKLLFKSRNGTVKEIQFKSGDWIVFRGVKLHAGSAYKKENLRLHFYHDSVGCKRKRDTTYGEGLSKLYQKKIEIKNLQKEYLRNR